MFRFQVAMIRLVVKSRTLMLPGPWPGPTFWVTLPRLATYSLVVSRLMMRPWAPTAVGMKPVWVKVVPSTVQSPPRLRSAT